MTLPELYFLFIFLPGFGNAAAVLAIVGGIAYGAWLFLGLMFKHVEEDDTVLEAALSIKRLMVILIIFFSIIGAVMPSQKDMLLLVGGYAATNNKELAKFPDNVMKAMNNYLEKITDTDKKK